MCTENTMWAHQSFSIFGFDFLLNYYFNTAVVLLPTVELKSHITISSLTARRPVLVRFYLIRLWILAYHRITLPFPVWAYYHQEHTQRRQWLTFDPLILKEPVLEIYCYSSCYPCVLCRPQDLLLVFLSIHFMCH